MMNRKKIFAKKKATGVAALIVAIAIILTGTFAWKDFSQSAISLFSGNAVSKHYVSLVDDFVSATDSETNTLVGWERGDVSTKKVYVTSDPDDDNANLAGYNSVNPGLDEEYDSVFVRVKLTQSLTMGGEPIIDPAAGINVSDNQYPMYVQWAKDGTIKTIEEWVADRLSRGKYWILDDSGWLYWAEPLEFRDKTDNLLDSAKLLVEPTETLEYVVNVKLEAVSSDLYSTTGPGIYEGGFASWDITDANRLMPLFKNNMDYSYQIGYETLIMKTGDTQQFTLSMSPSNKPMPTATWSSDDEDVATVNINTGEVSAVANGTATITATVGGIAVSEVTVTVTTAETFAFTIDTSLDATKGNEVTLAINNATGNNLVIDWGDGTTSSTLTGTIAAANRTHTYVAAKEYTVKIIGTMPSAMSFNGETRLTAVQSGFLENTATTMQNYFLDCANLKTIPGNLFAKSIAVTSFEYTFRNCSSLTGSIPADLFKNNTKVSNFSTTFQYCSSLTGLIPADLFKTNAEVTNFLCTFAHCSSLTGSIPTDLFKTNTAVTNFQSIFYGCTGLSGSIPADLFKTNTAVKSFEATFADCGGLTGSIPAGLFDATGAKVATFYRTFRYCSGITSVPADLFKTNTAVTTFQYTFQDCISITSLPKLWESHSLVTPANHTDTFTGCIQATNLQDAIDNGWAQ